MAKKQFSRQKRRDRRMQARDVKADLDRYYAAMRTKEAAEDEVRVRPEKMFRPSRVEPKTENQGLYMEAIENNDLVFGLGPAGSGKTFVAVAKAVEALRSGDVRKIVFCRPHLGLGKSMGFLKGDLMEKMGPYVRPLFDALKEFYSPSEVKRLLADEQLEVVALEFIRGTTFKHSFVILDEAQNATEEELKAFLTRLGEGSVYVISGDVSRGRDGVLQQSDLHPSEQGGLERYADRFGDLPGVAVVPMTVADSVRHPLVKRMLQIGF